MILCQVYTFLLEKVHKNLEGLPVKVELVNVFELTGTAKKIFTATTDNIVHRFALVSMGRVFNKFGYM